MRFSVLGPVSVSVPDGPVPIEAPKQRLLLAHLISRAGQPLPPDTLIELLWGDAPPSSARKALAWHLLQLRNSLGGRERVVWNGTGYVLGTGTAEVDARIFEDRYRHAAAVRDADPAAASRLLSQGLALWRGAAYGDLAETGTLRDEANRLEELRLLALELRCDADLELGRHAEIVPELTGLVADHPFRERLRCALMLALYRSGRQADALRVYREGRDRIVGELGLEPGAALRRLEQRILNADPDLEPTRPAAAAVVPAQLPADLRSFTGRETEVERLLELSADENAPPGTIVVGAVDGMAGVGKTALAVHVAQRLAPSYPQGQLFIDLHGFTEGVSPVEPGQALERMLRALGVAAGQIPAGAEDRSALYRSVLADRRVLIVLDNAAAEAQVTPLLPGTPRSLVLVTSRRRLVGLDGARHVQLDVLPEPEAIGLLLRLAGVPEPSLGRREPAAEIVRLCGRLPLAIRIAAAKLRHRRHWTLETVRDRLLSERRRLAQLELGERSVSAAFAMSYDDIDAESRRVFRLLGLFPGARFDAYLAAAVTGTPLDVVAERLDVLVEANLLSAHGPDRYGFHDLLRQFAVDEALARPGDEPRLRRRRLLEYYLHTVHKAATNIDPGMPTLDRPGPTDLTLPVIDTTETAHRWYHGEHLNLVSVVERAGSWGLDEQLCRLVHVVCVVAVIFSHYEAQYAMCRHGLEAARRCGDRQSQARLLNHQALALRYLNRPVEAIAMHERSMVIRRELGDRRGEAAMLNNIGLIHRRRGDIEAAIDTYHRALAIADGPELISVRVLLHSNLAECRLRLDQPEVALTHVRLAGEDVLELGNQRQAARLDYYHGVVYTRLGRFDDAQRHFDRALAYCERVTEPYGHANVLNGLANLHRERGRPAQALEYHQHALRVCLPIHDEDSEATIRFDLARTRIRAGQVSAARQDLAEALALATRVGDVHVVRQVNRELERLTAADDTGTPARPSV